MRWEYGASRAPFAEKTLVATYKGTERPNSLCHSQARTRPEK